MFKKLLIPVLCVASLFAASEAFATDKAIKAVSGEAECYGYFGASQDSSVVFRNFDPTHSISITKIRVYRNNGSLMASYSPSGYPAGFQEPMKPFAANTLNTRDILTDTSLGRLTFRINFKTTDGIAAITPWIASALNTYSSDTKQNLDAQATFDCVYTILK
ncbi:MAG: hypothetical protein PHH59_12835 [Methylovulum sp.]|uniref:hypothetical protein n=1 Tax=Methylovulum sp. TaxID=1916980 RepID=UPI0026151C87|nr:hypothetical protein [Methylovulum sp.]MDD2724893.1 hypothetical protein [Methylovulum sp.]MDD5124705.1 hypothetical protein [Methylovulum sp.]